MPPARSRRPQVQATLRHPRLEGSRIAHTARNDPVAQHTSLYAWSLWAAAQDRLPPLVCGPSPDARRLEAEVFGSAALNRC